MVKRFKKINLDTIIFIIISIVMLFIPIVKIISYICNYIGLTKDIFVINQVYVLYLSIPFLLTTYIVKKKKITWYDGFIYFLIITAIISTLFAVNKKVSILGFYGRYEGLITLISYYLIFLNVKEIKNKKYYKYLIYIFIFLGLFQTQNAFLQVFSDYKYIIRAEKPFMAMAFCGNPNFYGSYMVMLTLITSVLYLINKKCFILYIIFFIGLILANSTGPFLGYILAIIFFIIIYKKHIKLSRVGILLFTSIICFLSVNYILEIKQSKNENFKLEENYTIKSDLLNINNKEEGSQKIDNGRIDIWKRSLPLVKKYFSVGAGIDNYYFVFKDYPLDKAHNIYLQILVTNGLPSLLLYLGLCLLVFIRNIKFKDPLTTALFVAFVGYSIQGFANISVIDVAPYFYIIMGIIASEICIEKNSDEQVLT